MEFVFGGGAHRVILQKLERRSARAIRQLEQAAERERGLPKASKETGEKVRKVTSVCLLASPRI